MSFYSDYEKKKNKNKTSALLKVPQVVPQKPAQQDNSRRATAARNREQQRVQAHQNAQRPASTYLTGGSTTRSQPYAASQQRNTVFQQRGNTRHGFPGTGSRNTQQNNVRQPASTYLTGGSVTRSQPYAASQQNQLFSARKAAEQRRNPRQNVSTANKSSGVGNPTLTQFLKNSMDWHTTSDPQKKAQLHAQNDALRRKLGYDYNPQTGASFDKFGHEMTAGVRMAYGSTPTERLNQATKLLHTSGVMGKTDKATVYPTAMQAAQGLDENYFSGQTGYNAHKTMYDLFNRSDETWSSEDTHNRDRARQELSNEMFRILKRYGLDYQPRDNADDIMNQLKAAGADEQTLAYVQENIDLRHAADRLGNSLEAVGKRWIASLPSLVDTSRQVSANVEESRQNEEYRQLEEQEQTLELTLQGMNSTAADGSVPADYQAVYDQLQEVKKRKNELTVNKGVDPNKWSQRMLREANEAQANAEAGLAPAPRWLTEQGISLAGNAPVMAASAIPVVGPAVGSIMMGGQAAGQRSFELNEQGKGARESLTRGLTSGAIEAATERLPLGQMSKILHSGGVNAVKNILIQMGEEATEESASYFMNYVADLAANDPDAKFSLAELTQSAAGGAFGGLVFGTAGAVGSRAAMDTERMNAADAYDYNQVQQLVQLDSELQAALKLPEGPIRERAVQTAQNKMADKISGLMTQQVAQNAELTANYDADLNNRMSLAQRAQAAEYLNQRTGQVNAWQDGQIKPRLDTETEQRAESSYRTPEEEYALQSQLAKHFAEEQQAETGGVYDKKTVENYRNQIDGTFDGSLPSDMNISLGQTPKVLQSLGAENLPLRMTQNAARKIAYPDGYMGGKHNLGIPALKHLQEQLNDPIAVLKSKSQHDSFVVLTEWNDAENNPVIAAIHLNKQGVVDDVNMLASAYGKRNLAALLGENNENVIYTKNNKGINQTLDGRLQLPGLLSDDTLVAYSIRQNAENSNTSTENVTLTNAMQYGRTPEQAMMEARAKAEGERARNGYEKGETMSFMTGTKMGYPSDTVSPDGSDIPSVDNSISPNAENNNTEVKPLGNYERYGKTPQKAAQELQEQLNSQHSFVYEADEQAARREQNSELRGQYELAQPVRRQLEKFKNNHPLSDKDNSLLQGALLNGATDKFSQADDPAAVMHMYQLTQEEQRLMQPLREYAQARRDTLSLSAEEMADAIAEKAKDKRIPGAYSRETMERNSYDIFGKENRQYAETLNEQYFTPVHKAVADRTQYINTVKDRIAKLNLSKHESALVQMMLEGENGAAADYIAAKKIKVTSKLQERVANGVAEFRAIYDDMYNKLCDTLIANGMWDSVPGYLKDYAPHFTVDKPDTKLARVLYKFGIKPDSTLNLPTPIAGITDDRNPGKKWFGNLLHRNGELTEFDAVAGFDRYVETAGDVIFLTDSIQNLRTLEDAIRYRLSDDGTRQKINEIRKDRTLDPLERHQQTQDVYDKNVDDTKKLLDQKHAGMGGYVANLHEYINNLAGKKARADRGWEEMLGRQMYNVAKNVEGRVAANMIALNPGSWITNFIPLTQAAGEVSTPNLLRAAYDTVKSAIRDDGFTDGSVFLTNREGTQMLDRTLTRKVSDLAGMPMEAIDHFTANIVTRGKYLQNIADGMTVNQAFENADAFASNLMADRSKGAQPTAFNAVNPIRKMFTMFQLEVNNQLSYLAKDLPRAKQNKAALAWSYTKIFAGAYLFNQVYHQLTGRDSALDPIGMIVDAFGLDDDDDKDKKKKSGVDIALDLGENVAEQIPFVGGLLGGGRVPISSAFPAFGKLKEEYENGYDNKRIALDAAKSAANSAAYLLLPFGGGAVKKALEGAATIYAGGSYSLDKNGEKILQFPQYGQSPRDWAQAMLFGKSSLQGAQEWADDDYQSLNADETKAFDELRQHMNWFKDENGNTIDNSEAVFAAIKAMRAITDEMKEKYPDDYTAIAAGKKREMLFNDNDLNEIQKKYLDRELIGSSVGASGDYSSRDMFDISQKVREARQDDAMEALKHGISVDEFANWDGIIEETLADNEVDAKDFVDGQNNELYKKNEALLAILNEYGNSGEHTDAEKNAFADYLLISAMEDSDKERWDEVKGTVNATDFVKFASDMTTYNKEYKGSGMSKSDAMQSILDGYKNLSDTQKDALFGVYSDSASGNAFHISKYEDAIKDNSFYSCLKDAGKKELRSLLNSYEKHVADNAKLDGWEAKAAVAKEAGISPGIYALFQVALQEADTDGKGLSQAKAKAAVESVGGLTQAQKAYLWQSANKSWKKNPYGSATVSEYKYAGGEFANPVEGGTISSKFGPRDTFATSNGASSSRWHKSIDIAAPAGSAIKSVKGGKVTANGWVSGYGWTIEVAHDNGYVSMYHHMQNQSSVAVGTEVKQGQTIGNVGSTGNSTGPHLDLTITKDGTPVDPASLIGDYKNAKTGYVYEGSPVYTQLSSAASKSKKSSGGSRRSGGSSSGGLKQLKGLSGLKGLGF
ncbi:MAG: peptidoglycan DD-metalloendopeptidase family protein [Clostridiaceae bacterium]|nr:peptidoglycan DD-metalloendopeptidase family protein [Clostridiaceae bacterium]